MGMTTLCYIEKDNKYLMLHRIKKEHDINKDKWIGVGGHFEHGESPEDCMFREVMEETGLTPLSYRFCGIVTFLSDMGTEKEAWEYMCLYHIEEFKGEIKECDEGVLEWVDKEKILDLDLWEGDRLFLRYMQERRSFFSLKLVYEEGNLVQAVVDGKDLEFFDILDENGNKTGKIKERSLVHEDGDIHGTVHIWIRRKTEKGYDLLLQKRSKEKDSFPGCYDISSAGHISAGDEPLETALRELEEELKKFITDKGNLWYLYTDFHNGISTHCTIWIENDWNNHYDFIYRDYGYDNVNATSAKEIFEILADDINCLYKPEIQKKLLGTDSAEYLVYPSFDGDYHIVPGSSRSSYDYILKNIAIYSNTSWKCRQQERANKISTSSATNIHYKQT
mgnify:CR=1 FL=1